MTGPHVQAIHVQGLTKSYQKVEVKVEYVEKQPTLEDVFLTLVGAGKEGNQSE